MLTPLLTISMRDCLIEDMACNLMFHALTRLRRVTHIDLSQNMITDVGLLQAIEEMSDVRKPQLICLRFNDNKIGDESAMQLFKMLQRENHVNEICLAENCLTEQFSEWLTVWLKAQRARNIEHSHNLTKIDLWGNNLTIRGHREIGH